MFPHSVQCVAVLRTLNSVLNSPRGSRAQEGRGRARAEGWTGTPEEWRQQESVNAHSHLQSMLLGNSESFSVQKSELQLGTWQSVLLVDSDGPRTRQVVMSFTGVKR
jgi:hypothetical protein